MRILDTKIREHLPAYVAQSAMAMAVLAVLFVFGDIVAEGVIFAAIGSTTFVIFAMPRSPTALPRRVIGGHLVGIVVGSTSATLLQTSLGLSLQEQIPIAFELVAALSVGMAVFLMAATNTEHAPAGGTTLGLVLSGWNVGIVVFLLVASASLSLFHQIMGERLRDLV